LKLKNVSKMFFAQSRSQRVTPGSASGWPDSANFHDWCDCSLRPIF
jgi:hypothetical protein